ncbi:MAG: CHAT domain-containing protein [Candidatus Bathyarchaeia archaeon]|jgi:CHAT domain-containing protein
MTVASKEFFLEQKTLSSIIDSYSTVAKLVGKKKTRNIDFFEALSILGAEIGFGIANIFEHFGLMYTKRRINLTLKLDDWTRRIPWELAMVPDYPEQLLCERFNIGRAMDVECKNQWETAPNTKTSKRSLKSLVVGLNYTKNSIYTPLDRSEEDAKAVHEYLTKFSKSKNGRDLEVLPKLIGGNARKETLEKRLKEGITMFHFSGHGELYRNIGKIILANDKQLTTKELSCIFYNNQTRAPTFSFMNACETCLQKNGESDIHDWALAMATYGARALIGTFWSVMDEDATDFSLAFYRYFLKEGKTIGDSVRRARLFVKDKKTEGNDLDPMVTWSAFVLYGPPMLKARDILV